MVLTSNAVARPLCDRRSFSARLRQLLILPVGRQAVKLLLIMKLTAIILLTACLAASANGYTQQISISVKEVSLDKVFTQIEKQSGYLFFYTKEQMVQAGKVTIDVKNASLEDVLVKCFTGLPFTYEIINKTILVKPKRESSNEPASIVNEPATTIDVKGKIVNESGDPVAASITVKGTQQGATTNEKGEFEIKAVDENATLIITGVSIEKFEVKLNGKRTVFYTAKTKVTSMNEVVINKGYYSEKEKTSVSNTVKITAKDIEKQPVQNPLLALQGRVPGLFVTQGSGNAGSVLKVRVQGENSMRNGNNPLYVVDGVPIEAKLPSTSIDGALGNGSVAGTLEGYGNPLNYLNPLDIESIEILKDADATAIYGSRAANGAILITTKKGKAGQMKIDLNMETGWGKMNRRMDMLNTRQYLDMRYEAFANDGINWRSPTYSAANDLKVWDTTRTTDWQDYFFGGTSRYNNVNASVSGGSPTVRYLISGTYHKETTIWPLPDDFADQRGAMHFNLNSNSENQKFKLQFSGNYMFDDNQLPSTDMTRKALLTEPHAPPLLNADGTINWAQDANGNSTWGLEGNVMTQLYTKYVNKTHNLLSSLRVDYSILPGLTIGSSVGYNYMQTNDYIPSPLIAVSPELRARSQRGASFGDRNLQSWIIEPQASYETTIGKGTLNILAGSTFQDRKARSGSIYGTGQLSDDVLDNINSATTITKNGNSAFIVYRYTAVFGRATYNWDDKYILTMNARRDGSTRFGANNRFHNFGSVGAAWLFSSEEFIKSKFGFLSFGKLRANYGTTGNDQIGDYQFLSLYGFSSSSVPYQGLGGLYPMGLPNPELQWEETRKLQAGIDLGFFKDRLVLNINYVRNRSSNQLLNWPLPSPAGYSGNLVNFPATTQNQNWEFLVTGKVLQQKNINWTSSINLTIPRNKLIAFPGLSDSSTLWKVGKPIDANVFLHWLGVAAGTGDYLYTNKDGHPVLTPGIEDARLWLSKYPKLYGGFQNSLSYKQFQLDFLFQFVSQFGYNDLAVWNGFFRYPGMFYPGLSNQSTAVLDRWQKPGDNASVAKYSTVTDRSDVLGSDRRLANIYYISLKNVSLSWDVPRQWVERAKFRTFRMYLHAQNLFMISNYKGLNPETQSTGSLPPLQVWTVGVQLGL